MRLIFIGTSEFAVATLIRLNSSNHNILAVVTKPDRPKGRGKKISKSPIKRTAIELGCKILQPDNVNEKEFINDIKKFEPDLFVVLSFGQILCRELLKIPKWGAINVHPSLIPKYRGPAPIQWAIINGEKKTGVTTMLMDRGVDTGNVLMSEITNIGPYETSSCLRDRLSDVGSNLLLETIDRMQKNTITPKPQDSRFATVAPLLRKKDGEIDWNVSAQKIESFIRGVNPWPGAFTFYNGSRLKIIKANAMEYDSVAPPGTILESCKKTLIVSAGNGSISVDIIQGESGKIMPIKAFLCGFCFKNGFIMGKVKDCVS